MVGGHSVDDPEPKFGMAVIGEVHPDHMLTTAGGCAGDRLVLTKPLGTGILATALKRDALLEAGIAEAVRSMRTLNAGASRAALEVGVSAATDVTGFGLVGHLLNLLEASRVGGELFFDTLPILSHARQSGRPRLHPGWDQAEPRGGRRTRHLGTRPLRDRPLARRRCADLRWSAAGRAAREREGPAGSAASARRAGRGDGGPAYGRQPRPPPGAPASGRRRSPVVAPYRGPCMRWTADRLDQLERAVRDGLRVALTTRRGTEYIVIAVRLATAGPREALVARLPMTGEELSFVLDDITAFQVLQGT